MRAPDVPPAGRGGEALSASANLEPLLDRLETLITATAAGKSFRPVDRQVLMSIVVEAALIYDGTRYLADEASRCTFHELGEPLARVIESLKHDANRDSVFVALGAPATLALSPDQRAVEEAVARYDVLLGDLDKIARAVPEPPAKRGPGRPARKDLLALVAHLANYWERATGECITQLWSKDEPISSAAQFIHAVVLFIDPQGLRSVPEMMEQIIKARRAAISGN